MMQSTLTHSLYPLDVVLIKFPRNTHPNVQETAHLFLMASILKT